MNELKLNLTGLSYIRWHRFPCGLRNVYIDLAPKSETNYSVDDFYTIIVCFWSNKKQSQINMHLDIAWPTEAIIFKHLWQSPRRKRHYKCRIYTRVQYFTCIIILIFICFGFFFSNGKLGYLIYLGNTTLQKECRVR